MTIGHLQQCDGSRSLPSPGCLSLCHWPPVARLRWRVLIAMLSPDGTAFATALLFRFLPFATGASAAFCAELWSTNAERAFVAGTR